MLAATLEDNPVPPGHYARAAGLVRFVAVAVFVEDKRARLRVKARRRAASGRHIKAVAMQRQIALRRDAHIAA